MHHFLAQLQQKRSCCTFGIRLLMMLHMISMSEYDGVKMLQASVTSISQTNISGYYYQLLSVLCKTMLLH